MLTAMENEGLGCPDQLVADGKLHRYTVDGDKPKSDNGWYVLHDDGDFSAGRFGSWKTGQNHPWCNKKHKELTAEERREYATKLQTANRLREAEQKRVQAACVEWCEKTLTGCGNAADDHPYLIKKQVKAFGLKAYKGSLIVPVRRFDGGKLVGCQFIYPNGDKKFKVGTAKNGAMHLIGKPVDTVVICEGYATGSSIHMATGYGVVVAFDAGNIKAVAVAIRTKKPDMRILIACDNDQWTKGNPGYTKAAEACKEVNGILACPRFKDESSHPTDFNDLHVLEGLDEVKRQINRPTLPVAEYSPVMMAEDEPPVDDAYIGEETHQPHPLDNADFVCLGYNHGDYYYLPKGSKQVVTLKAAEHAKGNLIALAPLQWWEETFPGKQGLDSSAAANWMIRANHKIGVYDPGRIRGRGAWEDKGRSVLHMGDTLIVDGALCPTGEIKSSFIYEAAIPMEFQSDSSSAVSNAEATRLRGLCNLLSWEDPLNGTLLAGWCVLSPICGALSWRPHIHITGASGKGKTWIVDNIVKQVAGPSAMVVQGSTTEAGIRQSLGHDARPVIFDEAEGEDPTAQKRMQAILELARQASSETDGSICKGTAGGKALSFRIRSMFCFSSIGVSATQRADQSRISVLGLQDNADADYFKREVVPVWKELITPAFCQSIRARSIRLIPVIKQNAVVFSEKVGLHLGSKRTGDQLGALLAGAYALNSINLVDEAAAQAFVEAQDWRFHKLDTEQTDEQRCLAVILDALIKLDSNATVSVAELIRNAHSDLFTMDTAESTMTLRRHGIKPVRGGFAVANNHAELAKKLRETPWATNWQQMLARLPGAVKTDPIYFSGSSSRAVMLPMVYVAES